MNDEQAFELAEKNGFQDDFGRWNFTDEELLDFVHELRQALAYSKQESVTYTGNGTAGREADVKPTGFFFQIPKREWVGLTEADIYGAMDFDDEFEFAYAIEAKLKEKNIA